MGCIPTTERNTIEMSFNSVITHNEIWVWRYCRLLMRLGCLVSNSFLALVGCMLIGDPLVLCQIYGKYRRIPLGSQLLDDGSIKIVLSLSSGLSVVPQLRVD